MIGRHSVSRAIITSLWRSHHETLQYVSIFSCAMFQKLLLLSLRNRLDACKEGSSFLLFSVAQFLSQICLRVKVDLFSGRMTVVKFIY